VKIKPPKGIIVEKETAGRKLKKEIVEPNS
jgi:hypothetical protein